MPPAWSALTALDLRGDEALGVAAAARVLARALELGQWRYEARQLAMARYSAVGFEAAAVMAWLCSPRPGRPARTGGGWRRCDSRTPSRWLPSPSMTGGPAMTARPEASGVGFRSVPPG